MAIKVIGFFQNPLSELIYDSPTLTLVPFLGFPGVISMDVYIDNNKGTIPYHNIRKDIIYNDLITDPYEKLIDGLEIYVLNDLKQNSINQQSTFIRTHNFIPFSDDTNNLI